MDNISTSICRLLVYPMLGALVLFLFSCQDPTAPKLSSLSGYVELEAQDSHENVSIHLYKSNVIDVKLRELLDSNSVVGFPLDDRHLFDHRKFSPKYSTSSNQEGFFNFKKVEQGNYILVALKEGYGVLYHFDLELRGSPISFSVDNPFLLKELIELPSIIANDYTFLSGRSYLALNDVTFLPGSRVSFESGSSLAISPTAGMIFHGNVLIEGSIQDPIHITTLDNMYENQDDVHQFQQFEISEHGCLEAFQGVVFSFSKNGLVLSASDLLIQESVFIHNETSVLSNSGTEHLIKNSVFLIPEGINRIGINLLNATGSTIHNCLFYEVGKIALLIEDTVGAVVQDNYFYGGEQHLLNRFKSQTYVENCTFDTAKYNVQNTGRSTLDIQLCDIKGETCIYTKHTGNMINSPATGWTRVSHSNLVGSVNTVNALGYFASYEEYIELDFTNNYWGTSSAQQIEDSIIDYYDLEPSEFPSHAWPLIKFVPFKTSRIANAGVRNF